MRPPSREIRPCDGEELARPRELVGVLTSKSEPLLASSSAVGTPCIIQSCGREDDRTARDKTDHAPAREEAIGTVRPLALTVPERSCPEVGDESRLLR